jgi:nicotinate-nucleotide pyrophosphorylase (carboxylating)
MANRMMDGFDDAACRNLVDLALREDLGPEGSVHGDITSRLTIPVSLPGAAVFVARQEGTIAGIGLAERVFRRLDDRVRFAALRQDGSTVSPGERLATVVGNMRSILAGERTALNFVQHLSGIASLTRRYVDAVAGLSTRILDTRKTIPGERMLAKYAVFCGGGGNHRLGLSDMVLIKDNHLAALRDVAHPIVAAVFQARAGAPPGITVEVEVDTLEQLDEALRARADIVLLDNMPPEQMREAVRRRNDRAPGVLLEASGGINLQTVRAIAETGVNRISVGALTHSAPALDIGLDYETTGQPHRS